MKRTWTRQHRGATIVGGLATLLGVAAYGLGLLDRLYWSGFDFHLRHFSTIPADPRIVLIDIDDQTLRLFPDWPWPRRRYAQLLSTIQEAGGKAVVLDLVFAEPGAPRHEHPGLMSKDDADSTLPQFGDPAFDPIVFDDDELEFAMRKFEQVYLPMYGSLEKVKDSPHEAKDRAAAASFFGEHPDADFEVFFRFARPSADPTALTADRAELKRIFTQRLAVRHALSSTVKCGVLAPKIFEPVFPVPKFGSAAKGMGFAAFDRGKLGGVLRSLPVNAEWENLCLMQLGLLAGLDFAGLSRNVEVDSLSTVTLSPGENPRSATLISNTAGIGSFRANDLPIYWHVPASRRWEDSFIHLPAALVLEIAANRTAMEENSRRVLIAKDELMRLRHADTKASYLEYATLIETRLAGNKIESATIARNEPDAIEVGRKIVEMESEAEQWLTRTWQLWENAKPESGEEIRQREQIRRLHGFFEGGRLTGRMQEVNQKLESSIAERKAQLMPLLSGKLCFVGYTASAAADLVTTPVFPAMPGVMAHANAANMVLTNRFIKPARQSVNAALLAACGLIVVVFGAARGWRMGLFGALVIGLLVIAAGCVVFARADYYLASFAALAQTGFVWACVAVYRQAFEERTRRRLYAALAQYTSPQIAARITERMAARDLAPQSAMVTCFFCDISGFTRLSERLGPARTRDVLNPYLETVSRILISHGAIVNKFMGDGVFAFFNAPILPCSNHAQAACRAALEIASQYGAYEDPEFQSRARKEAEKSPREAVQQTDRVGQSQIDNRQSTIDNMVVRIGIATGEAFVGDYGSASKLDYTCIGDTPNLASRLEALNKELDTTILVDEGTKNGFAEASFSAKGEIAIPGRAQPAHVFELSASRRA